MEATQFLTNQIWDRHVPCNNLAFDHVSPESCWFLSQTSYNVIMCWSISKVGIRDKSLRSEHFPVYKTLHQIGQLRCTIWCNASYTGTSSDITMKMTFETNMMSCDPDLLVSWCMAHTLKVFGVLAIKLSRDERPNTPD